MTQQYPPHGQYPQQPPQWQPQPAAQAPAPKRRKKWPWVVGAILLLFVIVGVASGGDKPPASTALPAAPAAGGVREETWTSPAGGAPYEVEGAPAAASGPQTTFGSGTHEVGVDIEPGKYKTQGGGVGGSCYWARLKNTDGDFDSIITNGNTEGPATVTIAKSDGAFQTTCDSWVKAG